MEPPNGVQRELGVLAGRLDGIAARLDKADESRARLYEKLDSQSESMGKQRLQLAQVNHQIDGVQKQVAQIVAAVERFEAYERQGRATVTVLSFVGSRAGRAVKWTIGIVVAATVTFWRELLEILWPP